MSEENFGLGMFNKMQHAQYLQSRLRLKQPQHQFRPCEVTDTWSQCHEGILQVQSRKKEEENPKKKKS
jgi:hypothetical protein